MLKPKNKSTQNIDTVQELILMRHSIRAIRERLNEDLDAMAKQIERLLPPPDTERSRRFKNFTKKDWHKYLRF